MGQKFRAAIFDLDGVIVDTVKYHYLAWKSLAKYLGFNFTERDNERLKGVSRMRSQEILLELGNITTDEITKTACRKEESGVHSIGKENWSFRHSPRRLRMPPEIYKRKTLKLPWDR